MEIIKNNPYRILGILAGSTAKEKDRQIRRLRQYLEAGQNISDDFSLPILGKLDRTTEIIDIASSKLSLDEDKMNASLFWFYKGNDIVDEPAFDSLKEGDVGHATEIWLKLVDSGIISDRNYSAYQNLSNLMLAEAFNSSTIRVRRLELGISLKLKFIESDYIKNFKETVVDKTYQTTKKELQLFFLKQVQVEIESNKTITLDKYLEIVNKHDFLAKTDFLKEFIEKPIRSIEDTIDSTRNQRIKSSNIADKLGNTLYSEVINTLTLLKKSLGEQNFQFRSISDKVSEEILQCGIDYFKHYQDTDIDPSKTTIELFVKAKSLAFGNIAKQRYQENYTAVQEWVENKPERDKQNRIKLDLDALITQLTYFENKSETINNAKLLISNSKPHLTNIKNVLGASDELYLKLSTKIVAIAQHNIIEEVNKAQENLEMKLIVDRYGTISKLKITLKNAWDTTTLVGNMDMEADFRKNRYNTNKISLMSMCTQLGVSTSFYTSSSSTNSSTRNATSPRTPSSHSQGTSSSNNSDSNSGCIWGVVIAVIIFIIIIASK